MNFITLHLFEDGSPVTVNADAIDAFYLTTGDVVSTRIIMRSDAKMSVSETPHAIGLLLNPMNAFAGKRDVGTAAEQDTRTKLLVEAYIALPPVAGNMALLNRIAREVGEAAIEQNCNERTP